MYEPQSFTQPFEGLINWRVGCYNQVEELIGEGE
jgi:hypothetical protein